MGEIVWEIGMGALVGEFMPYPDLANAKSAFL